MSGFTVAVTADRRREEQAELLRRLGARVIEAPVLRTVPLTADEGLRRATEHLIAHPPDVFIATTAIGVRGWLVAAQAWGLDDPLMDVLRSAEIVARGPKVHGALRQAGLHVVYEEPSEQLAPLIDRVVAPRRAGAHIAIQLYGEDVPWAIEPLVRAGADVTPVRVYRWAEPEDADAVRRLVGSVLDGRVDAVTYTSVPAVSYFFRAAGADARAVVQAFNRSVVAACVGPVTARACREVGILHPCAPEKGRLGLLMRALADTLSGSHRHVLVGEQQFLAQGSHLHADGITVELTGRERAVLDMLITNAGAVVSRETLLREVWRTGEEGVLDKTMSRLRARVAPTGLVIDTVARRGHVVWATPVACPALRARGQQSDTARSAVTADGLQPFTTGTPI